ncbi:MAG TPA: lytic transglycosylase domain-containing protein [Actinomycetota bacterium]|nr:lytic transglycosylase domain-containing protein [Actinomycetota bacterium]
MTRCVAFLLAAVLAGGACSSGPDPASPIAAASPESSPSDPSPAASPSPSVSVSPAPEPDPPFVPAADEPLPRRAAPLARRLELVSASLRDSVADWIGRGTSEGRPPWRVTLQALYQQRIYRLLSRRPDLARRVLPRVQGALRREAEANVTAGARLRSLVTPLKPPVRLKTGPAEPAGRLLRYYRRAERRFGVEWEVLAAVNYVETKFGRVRSSSSAGAQGPMQFLPTTWDAYGLGGDIDDPRDAILGAANYLNASGAPGDYRGALYAYNHSDAYVDAVLLYAGRMKRRPASYYEYYSWQVFVITTKGDRRLTGPGSR